MRGRTLRTETLDRSNARDLEQVVRILREVDVSPVSPSSTTRMAERQKQIKISQCEIFMLRSLSPAKFIRHSWITSDEKNVNKPLRDVRHRAQKWNVGKSFTVRRIWNKREGTRNESCGCFRKRTPFLRGWLRLFVQNYVCPVFVGEAVRDS